MTETPFQRLKRIAATLATGNEKAARSEFIRFLDTYDGAQSVSAVVDSLAVEFGLYPYVTANLDDLSEREAVAIAYHSPKVLHASGFTFHSEQQRIYERLMDGANVVLSAPTSFGKSVIIDALISSNRWNNIVLLVPTIALIDETRRRLAQLRSSYTIVSSPQQTRGEKNVYVMTQERYLELTPVPKVDFFVIDEFYKLGSGEGQDARRSSLNIAWRNLKNSGAQFYLIGPNIDAVNESVDEAVRDALYVSDYNTVVVDVEDRSTIPDDARLADMKHFLATEAEGSSLIFVSSPHRAHEVAVELIADATDGLVSDVADWVSANYDPHWAVAQALRGGVGTHTGPMPRSLQRAMIRLFEQRRLSVLVCTTTLIEGVNTVAKNVVIYDKKIDRKPIDFFTFSNIRGRAGRMLKHFVGRVVSYAPMPDHEQSLVDIPIESQSPLASLATLVQLPENQLTDESQRRLEGVLHQDILGLDTIRANRGIDPERQVEVARTMLAMPSRQFTNLEWSGRPTYDQLLDVLTMAYEGLLEGRDRQGVNPRSIVSRLNAVRQSGGSIPAMVESQMPYRGQRTRSDVVDDVLQFQRTWMEFRLPSMLRAVGAIQREVASQRRGGVPGNYEFALREIESFYLPPFMAELDDYGLPLPLALKLNRLGLRGNSIEEVVARLAAMARNQQILGQLTRVERWFLSDAATGLTREMVIAVDSDGDPI